MELRLSKVSVRIFYFIASIQYIQSISFSDPISSSVLSKPSFWQGIRPSTLFETDIRLQVYLNEVQGLLFYGIDNTYQTLWIQLDNTNVIISYYNFKELSITQFSLAISKLCGLQEIKYKDTNLAFTLSAKSMKMDCNHKKQSIYYSPYPELATNNTLKRLFNEMKLPVPTFTSSNDTNQTYIWIGNTPTNIKDGFQNTRLEAQAKNLVGCVRALSFGNQDVNLTTDGILEGNMAERLCRPICDSNPCQNQVHCIELWRERYNCDCGLSGYAGEVCNASYAVEFNGGQKVSISHERKLRKFEVVFKQVRPKNELYSTNLVSIQYKFNQTLDFYIDNTRHLTMTTAKIPKIDHSEPLQFIHPIEYNVAYLLIFDVEIDNVIFKLVHTEDRRILEQQKKSLSLQNLVMETILVADSNDASMTWMNKFSGCISNLILTVGKNKFNWNSIENFTELPTCEKKNSIAFRNMPNLDSSTESSSLITVNEEVSQTSPIPMIIGIIFVIVCVVVIVAIFIKFKDRIFKGKKDSNVGKRAAKKTVRSDTGANKTPMTTPLIPYKPPHKARTLLSPEQGTSATSLPHSITPTPNIEEEELV